MNTENLFLLPSGELGFFVQSMGYPHYRKFNNQSNFTIEQCTGQRDRNGNLIYEGDVIKIKDDYDTYGQFVGEIREVYYHEGGFRLKPKWNKNARGNYLEDTEDFEIIGNIHEDQFREVTNLTENKQYKGIEE
jgi:uncharacterized phage protein (TIGR01671 family)